MRHLALLAALLASLTASASAAPFRFSGTLRDASGRPLDGSYLLRFSVAGEAWSESRYVKAEGGRFSALLGSRTPLPDSALRGTARVLADPPAGTGWSVLPDDGAPAVTAAAPPAPAQAYVPPSPPADPGDLRQLERELDQARRDREESKRRLEALERAVSTPQTAGAAAPASRLYVVQAGDTLRTVAKKTLGDERHWVLVYQANADRIQRAGELVAGQKLVIPAGTW
ncbi:hypothetical protein EPO15_09570 [bacterium]|nr:MAG: hypothetical protein EPO15_09570 [bacterium]